MVKLVTAVQIVRLCQLEAGVADSGTLSAVEEQVSEGRSGCIPNLYHNLFLRLGRLWGGPVLEHKIRRVNL